MAKPAEPFHEFVQELFSGLGAIHIRRMFGGAGVFREGIMFALLADETIYLKADETLRSRLMQEGGEAFLYVRSADSRPIDLGYVSMPTHAMDDPEDAAGWGRLAFEVAVAAKSKQLVRKKRKA